MKAKIAGIDVLTITDHDTTAGWAEASAAAEEAGIQLVLGVEISTRNDGQSQHLLAYRADENDASLVKMLLSSIEARKSRIPATLDKIAVTQLRFALKTHQAARNATITNSVATPPQ